MKKYYYLATLAIFCFILAFGSTGALAGSTSDAADDMKPCYGYVELPDGKIALVTSVEGDGVVSEKDKLALEQREYDIEKFNLTLMGM